MTSPRHANRSSHMARVAVPPDVRRRLAELDVTLGRVRASKAIGLGEDMFAEAVSVGAMVSERVLARIVAGLRREVV